LANLNYQTYLQAYLQAWMMVGLNGPIKARARNLVFGTTSGPFRPALFPSEKVLKSGK